MPSYIWVNLGTDDGLLPVWHQAITWIEADLLSIGHLVISFSEMRIKMQQSSLKKMLLKILPSKWQPFCSGLNVLNLFIPKWSTFLVLLVMCVDISFNWVKSFMQITTPNSIVSFMNRCTLIIILALWLAWCIAQRVRKYRVITHVVFIVGNHSLSFVPYITNT